MRSIPAGLDSATGARLDAVLEPLEGALHLGSVVTFMYAHRAVVRGDEPLRGILAPQPVEDDDSVATM